MRRLFWLLLLAAIACGQSQLSALPSAPTEEPEPEEEETRDAGRSDASTKSRSNLRLLAGNISSGQSSTYDPAETTRILEGLHPDVAMLQELKIGGGTATELDDFVAATFGEGYESFRETGAEIPNAIVSRYPIVTAGQWVDPNVANRSFVYAKITVPGPHPLWAVSVHLLTTSSANRNAEATALVAELAAVVEEGDYITVGGDFNTDGRMETCIGTFRQILTTEGPFPVDQNGNGFTSAPRSKPYDWVLTDPELTKLQVPTVIGKSRYPAGLVFDSRVYTPLAEVAPIEANDSAAVNMQHMPVVRDFYLAP